MKKEKGLQIGFAITRFNFSRIFSFLIVLVFFTGRQVLTNFYFIFKRSFHYLAFSPLKTHPLAIRYAVSNRCVYTHLPIHLQLRSIYTYTAADQAQIHPFILPFKHFPSSSNRQSRFRSVLIVSVKRAIAEPSRS